jgi:hypothetical protein
MFSGEFRFKNVKSSCSATRVELHMLVIYYDIEIFMWHYFYNYQSSKSPYVRRQQTNHATLFESALSHADLQGHI